MFTRNETRAIKVGNLIIGGGNPIRVQSMLKIPLTRPEDALKQAQSLVETGCEIIRTAVPDFDSASNLDKLVNYASVPIVADIHFDYKLAIASVENGVAGLRINPGNIGSRDRVKMVADCAKAHNVPIRIGVNGGSIEKDFLKKFNGPSPEAMVASALKHIRILEKLHFYEIKVSMKASSVNDTVSAYKKFAETMDYPLHIGITEAGPSGPGTIKSAVGLGILLSMNLGDTLRVSLTAPPEEEVITGFEILKALKLRERGPDLVSCPTCGRCKVNIFPMIKEVQKVLKTIKEPLSVAVMGCVVNGPGEAKEADIGIAGGGNYGILFKKGTIIGKYPEEELFAALINALNDMKKD